MKVSIVKTLGFKLAAFIVGLVVVGSSVVGIVSYTNAHRVTENQLQDVIVQMAQDNARTINYKVDFLLDGIESIAHRSEIRSMDWETQVQSMEREMKRAGYLGMAIVYPDGTARYTDGSTAQLGDRDYIKKAFRGEASISDVIISRVINRPVIMIAAPIKDDQNNIIALIIARKSADVVS